MGLLSQKQFLSIPATFFVGFALLYFRNFLSSTTFVDLPDSVDKMLLVVGLVFLILFVLQHADLSVKKALLYAGVAALTLLVYVRAGETAPVVFWAMTIAVSLLPDKEAALRLWLTLTASLLVILVCFYGVIYALAPDLLDVFYRNTDDGTVTRYAFFMSHPNMVGTVTLSVVCAYFSLYYNRIGFGQLLAVLFLCLLLYLFTNSKTSSLLILVLVVLVGVSRSKNLFGKLAVRRFCAALPVLLILATYLLATVFYSDSISDWLTGRVGLWHTTNIGNGVTILGQPMGTASYVNASGNRVSASTVDSLYATFLYVFGLAFGVVYCVLCWRAFMREDDRNLSYMPALLVMIVYGITEVHMVGLFTSCMDIVLAITAFEPRSTELSDGSRVRAVRRGFMKGLRY